MRQTATTKNSKRKYKKKRKQKKKKKKSKSFGITSENELYGVSRLKECRMWKPCQCAIFPSPCV